MCMKKWNIVGIILVIAIVVTGGTGCMKISSIRDELVAYMQDKYGDVYGDTFSFKEVTGSHFGKPIREIVVSSERYPEAYIVAKYEKKDDGEVFSDNYMAVVYEEEVRSAIEEVVESVYGKCKVFYSPLRTALPAEMGAETTAEEFMGKIESEIRTVIFVETRDGEDRDELLETLRRALKEKGLLLRGSFLRYVNSESLDKVKENDYQTDNKRNIIIDWNCNFSLDREYEFLYADWS